MNKFIFALLLATGCSTTQLKEGIAERVDLGDGTILKIVPYSYGSAALNSANPVAGAALDRLQAKWASERQAKLGPFNGLPYQETWAIILTNGLVIQNKDILKIDITQIPVPPAPIVKSVSLQSLAFTNNPVTPNNPIVTNSPAVTNSQAVTNQPTPTDEDIKNLDGMD